MIKLYIDTNVLIYAIEDSKNIYGKNISDSSSKLFWESALCKYYIIISDWTLNEFRKVRKLENISMLYQVVKKKIISFSYTQEDIQQAKKQNPQHFQDELHGILALKAGADYIVTRNINDFKRFKNQIRIVRPEDLL